MNKTIHILAVLGLILATYGCSPTTLEPTSISQSPTPTTKPLPPETLSPSPAASATPTQSPTLMPICPAINPNVDLVLPTSDGLIDDNVLAYLNAGGDPVQIDPFLLSNNLTTLDVSVADLNDDNLNEVVVAGVLPLEFHSTHEGVIYIFACKNNNYELDNAFLFGKITSAKIIRTEKLLADYPPQLIVEYLELSGWGSTFLAIGFINGKLQVVFQDEGISSQLVIFDQDNDGNKEISLISITTATQGPHRDMISNYKWDGKEYVLVSNLLMPGRTRVDYLDDAQRALDQGDIPLAIVYYERAAYDDTLQDFASRGEWESHQTNLAGNYQIAFAMFRLSILWFSVRNTETAMSILDNLNEEFSKNKPGHEFAEAAIVFHDGISQGVDLKQACLKVSYFFTQNYPDLNIHIGDWGVSVVDYDQVIELCPFH